MKIVIAPDSFKESMTALEAANAIETGFRKVCPDATYIKRPMADGGEGTVQSLVDATNGKIMKQSVTGPMGPPVDAFYGLLGDGKTAVIEMAAASGLHLINSEERQPLKTTTRGTGELILAALEQGVTRLMIGMGGSATNDGGAGMAQALGAKLLNKRNEPIGMGGGELGYLQTIDNSTLDSRLSKVAIDVACDVNNPLTGQLGAAAVFGPQKGATPEMVEQLDKNLRHYAKILKNDLGQDVETLSGAGAAGGLGAGLVAFLDARLKRGVDIVMDVVKLDDDLKEASLVITGEGRMDKQTIYGKTPIGVAKLAKKYQLPVIGVAGSLGKQSHVVYDEGIDAVFSMVQGAVSLTEALQHAEEYMVNLTENLARTMFLAKDITNNDDG